MATSADLDLRVFVPVRLGSPNLRELSPGSGATRGATTSEEVTFEAIAGMPYFIGIGGFNRATANYNLIIS
ncbi:MAG TPA: hypothetical protein PKD72_01705 [Gemmatales bacterium]|nr:hypothetical protein [Gemmatales bacterium]